MVKTFFVNAFSFWGSYVFFTKFHECWTRILPFLSHGFIKEFSHLFYLVKKISIWFMVSRITVFTHMMEERIQFYLSFIAVNFFSPALFLSTSIEVIYLYGITSLQLVTSFWTHISETLPQQKNCFFSQFSILYFSTQALS